MADAAAVARAVTVSKPDGLQRTASKLFHSVFRRLPRFQRLPSISSAIGGNIAGLSVRAGLKINRLNQSEEPAGVSFIY